MATSARVSHYGILPVLFLAVSCMDDSTDGNKHPDGDFRGSGYFRIILNEKTEFSQGLPSLKGKIYDGHMPSSILWRETAKSGACTLFEPEAPLCIPGCGSDALCVSDDVCEAFPNLISAGKVTVTGVKTLAGANSFTMDPIQNGYQPPAGTNIAYIPFSEGDPVTVTAAGDTGVGAFVLNGKAVARLDLLNDSIALEDGKPVQLRWIPPGRDVGSTIKVMMDLSHHGGSKGKIECETADNGSLDVSASLVDALRALGVTGWPTIEVTRRTVVANPKVGITLEIESPIAHVLSIPGLISCTGDEDCPDGQTCQILLRCE